MAERCGQSSATLSDCVFPQPLWEPFGEHVGEEEEKEGEDQEKGGGGGLLGKAATLGRNWGGAPPGMRPSQSFHGAWQMRCHLHGQGYRAPVVA